MNSLHRIETVEDGVQQGNFFDDHSGTGDVDSVTNIERMLDKQEDTRTEELLGGNSENE